MSDPNQQQQQQHQQQQRPLLHQSSSLIPPEEHVAEMPTPKAFRHAPAVGGNEGGVAAQEHSHYLHHHQQQHQPPPSQEASQQQQEDGAGAAHVRKQNSLRAWQRLQKSTKRIVMGPQLSLSHHQEAHHQEQVEQHQHPHHSMAHGEGLEASNRPVVLNMDGGAGAAEGGGVEDEEYLRLAQMGLGASRQRTVHKSLLDVPATQPLVISEEAEQGLELLAHAVVADARAAQAEAAEVRAAAAEVDEDKEGRGGGLAGVESPRASGGERETLEQSPLEQPQEANGKQQAGSTAADGGALGPDGGQKAEAAAAPRLSKRGQLKTVAAQAQQQQHQGRKAVLMAKQQLVRTLTLSKHGEVVEMELPIKELLRYIQNAVRAVHISQGQYLSQQSIGASLGGAGKEGAPGGVGVGVGVGVGGGLTRSLPGAPLGSGAGPILRRSTQHSRTYSHSNVGLAGPGPSVAASTRVVAPPAPVGGLLNARDVRRLISGLDTESAKSKDMSILVRRHTIVLNLGSLRCLALWDRLIVVVPEGSDSHLLDQLEENLRLLRVQQRAFDMDDDEDDEEEFEFLALEAVLMTVTNELKDKLKDLRPSIVKNAKALLGTGTLNTKHQDELRQLKSKAASAQAKVRSLHRALFDILDDEEHLQMLHLTRIYTQQQQQQHVLLGGALESEAGGGLLAVDADRDDEAEALLESYLSDCQELIQKWELLKDEMLNTENFCLMASDMARNKLLTIGTIFALVNLCFACGAVVSGIFGMNLFNGMSEGSGSPDSFSSFLIVVGFIIVTMAAGGGSILLWMYKSKVLVT